MSTQDWLSQLQKQRAIAVIRAPQIELGLQMALAVASGGMQLIEITWSSDRPGELIAQLREQLPECTIGTGTLFNLQQLEEAIACGAEFLFTPHVDPDMIKASVIKNIPIIPGALTPTEIVSAWAYGASCVKIFPVQAVGGADYIKSLQGPLGHIPLIPTGGGNSGKCQRTNSSRCDRCWFGWGVISTATSKRGKLASDRPIS